MHTQLTCMLAYNLEWHMRERLASLLFVDEERPAGAAGQAEVGKRKDRTRKT